MTYDLRLVPQSGEMLAITPETWQTITDSPGIVVEESTGHGVAYGGGALPLRVDDHGILVQIPVGELSDEAFIAAAGHLRELGHRLDLILLDVPRGRVWDPGTRPDMAAARPAPPPPAEPAAPAPQDVEAFAKELLQLTVVDAVVGLGMAVAALYGLFAGLWIFLNYLVIDLIFLAVGVSSFGRALGGYRRYRLLTEATRRDTPLIAAPLGLPVSDPLTHGGLGAIVLIVGLWLVFTQAPLLHWMFVGGACLLFAAGEFFRLYRALRRGE